MKQILSMIIITALVASVHARLGEGEQQCTQRYGNVITTAGDWKTYQMGPYRISAHFNVRSKAVDTLCIQRFHEGKAVQLHAGEIKKILTANKGRGQYWVESDTNISVTDWRIKQEQSRTGDYLCRIYSWSLTGGSGTAVYETESKLLMISSNNKKPFPTELLKF